MKYFWLTLKHKWFVFRAGLKIGVPLGRLITHDLSKFLPSELKHYNRQFFGDQDDPLGFAICWLRHQNRNDHHWEYWVPRTGHTFNGADYQDGEPLPMPENAVREMVADWMGAGRAYEGKYPDPHDWPWYEANKEKIFNNVHHRTKYIISNVVDELRAKDNKLRYQNGYSPK